MLSADVRAGFLKLDQYIDVEDASATLVHRLNFADAVALVRR